MRLFKRKKNNIWYVEIKRGLWRSLKTRDQREAKIFFKELQREALRGKLLILERHPSISAEEFFKEYLSWAETNHAYNTYERTKRVSKKFLTFTGTDKPLGALNTKVLEGYIDFCRRIGNKPVTINTEIRHLKASLSKAVNWEYLKENPFRRVKQLKYMKIPPKFLTVEEVEKVFKTIGSDRRYRLIFAFYIYTGMRREEISRLQWKDINLKDDIITVLQTKNYESRTIPISEKLKNILKEYYSGANIGKVVDITLAQIGRGMKYFLRKAALLEVRPHDLRHTFASHLIMSGVDIKTVGELLGHKSLQATHIYVHLLSSHKIKAISKLPY